MANNVQWYCQVLSREDGLFLRMSLVLDIDGQRKKES